MNSRVYNSNINHPASELAEWSSYIAACLVFTNPTPKSACGLSRLGRTVQPGNFHPLVSVLTLRLQ